MDLSLRVSYCIGPGVPKALQGGQRMSQGLQNVPCFQISVSPIVIVQGAGILIYSRRLFILRSIPLTSQKDRKVNFMPKKFLMHSYRSLLDNMGQDFLIIRYRK